MKKAIKWLQYFVSNIESILITFILGVIVVDIFLQVLSRILPGNAISWTVELGEILFGALIWIGIGEGVVHNEHVNLDLFVQKLPLKGKKIFQIIDDILFIIFLALMIYLTGILLKDYIRFESKTTVLRLNLFWVRLPIVIGSIFGIIRLIIHSIYIIQDRAVPFPIEDPDEIVKETLHA